MQYRDRYRREGDRERCRRHRDRVLAGRGRGRGRGGQKQVADESNPEFTRAVNNCDCPLANAAISILSQTLTAPRSVSPSQEAPAVQDDDTYALRRPGARHNRTSAAARPRALGTEHSRAPLQISLHFILSFSHEDYGRATSLSNIANQFKNPQQSSYDNTPPEYYNSPTSVPPGRRANATFVLLARNSDLNGIVSSMKQNGAFPAINTIAFVVHAFVRGPLQQEVQIPLRLPQRRTLQPGI